HLADCDRCRKQVSSLAIATGAVARTEQSVAEKIERRRFWQILAGFFAVPVLRYAAFGAVLLIVAGVGFIALRPRGDRPALVASNESKQQEPVTAVKPSTDTNGGLNKDSNTARSASVSQSPATSDQNPKRDEDRVAENTTPPLQPMKEIPKPVDEAEKKAEQLTVAPKSGYAPAPPGEIQSEARAQTGSGGVVTRSDSPKKAEDKLTAADRERDMAKDSGRGDDVTRTSSQPSSAMRRAEDSKQKGPSRNMDNVMANNQSANEAQNAAPKTLRGEASTEERPQTRSVGGHKFRRQGNSWVDQKFKSSMTLKNISRGSDEFAALDSGVRSMAQQLGGEVIVVSKGKAYLIK
ncbi:MAG TPA: hypothetical protein DC054_20715, partial [Blastocatellia bacterium]|nr:hypothetical protein [Blastocatellia bacterium]